MPKITITKENASQDFGGGQVNPLVDPGVYQATVASTRHEVDDQGREKVVIDFRVDDNNGSASGQLFRKWLYFHQEETKRISIENLENIGVKTGWTYKSHKELVGKKCRIQVQRSTNSPENSEIKSILQGFVPTGEYKCKVIQVGDKDGKIETSKSGSSNPFLRIIHRVMEGPMEGMKIMDRLFLNDKALGVTAAKLGSMGAPAGDFDFDSQKDRQSIVGLWTNITYVETLLSDGKKAGKIQKVTKLGRNPGPTSTPSVGTTAGVKVDVPASIVAGAKPDDSLEDDDCPFENP